MILPVAHREADWLLYDASVPAGAPLLRDPKRDPKDVAATLLRLGSALPAGCKYAWVGTSDLRVRAEQPERAGPEARARTAALEAGFAAAADQLSLAPATKPAAVEISTNAPTADVARLCGESGWLFEERPEGVVVVDLGVSGSYLAALIEARNSGIAIETSIVTRLPDTGARRAALSALLLRANGAFRMVRAVFRMVEGEHQALLEAPLPADASAVEFGMALGAVAVAARHCAVEAQMLAADDRLSRIYLGHCRREKRPSPMPKLESSIQTSA